MVVTEPFLCPTCEGCVYKGQDESETQQQIFWDAHACDRQQDESDQCHPSKVHSIYISFYIILLQMYPNAYGLYWSKPLSAVMLLYVWYVNLNFITARTMSLASWTYQNLSLPHLRDEQAFLESESGSNLWLCIDRVIQASFHRQGLD